MRFQVGERLVLENEYCTVKYYGFIDAWPNIPTYGIEWDTVTRGKNSGSLNGKKYFSVSHTGAGSFIKETKLTRLVSKRYSFSNATKARYGDSLKSIGEIKFGSKAWEGYGFERLTERNNNISELETVVLHASSIYDTLLPDTKDASNNSEVIFLKTYCCNIKTLDLSSNLFHNFETICEIISYLPKLKKVDLSCNRFNEFPNFQFSNYNFERIENLNLSSCKLPQSILLNIIESFPNLKVLNLTDNDISDTVLEKINFPKTLKSLTLSNNLLHKFPKIDAHTLTNLKTLNIPSNKLERLDASQSNVLQNIDISDNKIKSMSFLDKLNEQFPNLLSLRCNVEDLFKITSDVKSDDYRDAKHIFMEIIARFNSINTLDGSMLDNNIRQDAELYFLSQVQHNKIKFPEGLRWKELCQKYNIKATNNKFKLLPKLDQSIIRLRIASDSNQLIKEEESIIVLESASIRYLKGIICRRLNLCIYNVDLSYKLSTGVVGKFDKEFYLIRDFNIQDNDLIIISLKSEGVKTK